jgi:hypothetical protein
LGAVENNADKISEPVRNVNPPAPKRSIKLLLRNFLFKKDSLIFATLKQNYGAALPTVALAKVRYPDVSGKGLKK